MGTYSSVRDELSRQFSIFQLMSVLRMGPQEVREARNLLKQFSKMGYVKRISKNMYVKLTN